VFGFEDKQANFVANLLFSMHQHGEEKVHMLYTRSTNTGMFRILEKWTHPSKIQMPLFTHIHLLNATSRKNLWSFSVKFFKNFQDSQDGTETVQVNTTEENSSIFSII